MSHNTLMILGMHRSGTSMLSNWLHHCGLHLGNRLLGSGVGNVRGHFEDLDFIELHDEMLKQVGVYGGGLTNVKNINLFQQNNVTNKITNLIKFKNNRGIDWGWKDPRTCLFLPAYQHCLPETKIIAVFRPPLEVVDSLLRRQEGKLAKRLSKRNKNSRLIKSKYYQLRIFVYSIYLRIFKAATFMESWIIYNELIVNFISEKDDNEFILISTKKLEENEVSILNKINSWGFSLKQKPLSAVTDKLIIHNSTAKVNSSVLKRARIIEAKLEELASY